jgi:starch phosphorylase
MLGFSTLPDEKASIAYFSMEVGLDTAMHTYSGGLGVLSGDTLRAAADLGVPMVAVTLLHRRGYFRQHLDVLGNQTEDESVWQPEEFLTLLPARVVLPISDRVVQVQAWRHNLQGQSGHVVPVLFLDTQLPENSPQDRALTDHLYGGDDRYRLCQEVILGIGGIAMLRALGYQPIRTYHMNEGHSALACLALVEEQTWGRPLNAATDADRETLSRQLVFTTHTPVSAGHDGFSLGLVREVLGDERADFLLSTNCCPDNVLNMTRLALRFSGYINGVSMRHEEVSRSLFTEYSIESVTNGVHATYWTSSHFQDLHDRFIPEWRRDNHYLRYAISIPTGDILRAHAAAKADLIEEVMRRTQVRLRPGVMTFGFARRATAYKRTDLLFQDIGRLRQIYRRVGPFQIVCAGKAHPRDEGGKALIRRIHEASKALEDIIPVVYLEEYDITLGKYLCSGVDLWLNTPQRPMEASGTSGMKAALNGIPSLSILDGWWIEGHIEGVTGWSIGDGWREDSSSANDATSLYDKLEYLILPMYYERPAAFAGIMRSCIALNGSYFNAQRMVVQYLQNAYLSASTPRTSDNRSRNHVTGGDLK